MNSQISSSLRSGLIGCALTLSALVSTQIAVAQDHNHPAQVTVPFGFQTSTQYLPAGTYKITRESSHLLLLKGPGRAGGFVVTTDAYRAQPADRGTVVFERYGNRYFLRQVWMAGSGQGLVCAKSRTEKEILQTRDEHATVGSVELALISLNR
jgi:hypothetical protein